jgi:hypothetical protein
MLREDFDLMADVELSEGAELDFVLRRVEPRPLQGIHCALQVALGGIGMSEAAAERRAQVESLLDARNR